ncbi:hypothetical protein D9M68_902720 [compost metagenome]
MHVEGALATTTPFFRPMREEQAGVCQFSVEARVVAVHRVVSVSSQLIGQVGLEESTYFFGEARRLVAVTELQGDIASVG